MRICRGKPGQSFAWFENQELSRQSCLMYGSRGEPTACVDRDTGTTDYDNLFLGP